jgi:DNA repair protein RecN (Recombination protein N)
MLTELSVRNYALVESLRLPFAGGLNALTGETGAGKSILIDALALAIGGKASASCVRKDAPKCEVSAVFDLSRNRTAKAYLKELSLLNEEDDDLLFLRREVDAAGKSRSFVNDRPVNLSTLSGLGDLLVDVHGQHDHQLLLKVSEQRDFLDRYAENGDLREEIAALYREWKDALARLESSRMSEQERTQRIDLYRFQVQEIEAAKLKPGEEEEIEAVLPQLKHAEKLRALADEVHDQLYGAEGSVQERLSKSRKSVESILGYGVDLQDTPALLEDAQIKAEAALDAVDRFRKGLVADPAQLDALISRQDKIAKLRKKYGATIEEVLAHFEKTKEELARLEGHAETLKELEEKASSSFDRLLRQGKKLSAARKKSADKLSPAIEKELKDLGFLKARFSIQLAPEQDADGKPSPTPAGLEKVEFLFSANPGEDPKPLKAVASGGELSRLMLALKKILAQLDVVPTVVFDEIDSGVGGSMGHVIGEKLKSLSRSHQVLLITHLPQIAAFAERQFSISKSAAAGRTHVAVEPVEREKRVREIARMLGGISQPGQDPTPASLRHASEMLEQAN